MSALAIVVMVVICGLVWGGFAVLLALALSRESRRGDAGEAAERGRGR